LDARKPRAAPTDIDAASRPAHARCAADL